MKIYNILNLGAGLQSTRIFLAACRGELPKFDAAVFADTQWEPKAVYENVEFLKSEAEKAGIPLLVRTRGNIREDAVEFRRNRKSADGKRYASLPTFVKNPDGTRGRVKRQCTKEYKIEVVETFIRRELLGIPAGGRVPAGVTVRQWFGISDEETRRAVFPGVYREKEIVVGRGIFGDPIVHKIKRWYPCRWKVNVYPLLNETWHPDRKIRQESFLLHREQRSHCRAWLARHYPGRLFPRSACIGCPFRGNAEWRDMRDNQPHEWADACDFDDAQRRADASWPGRRRPLAGLSYVHRQLVPLREADLDGDGEAVGAGCGTLFDGMDGLCDV